MAAITKVLIVDDDEEDYALLRKLFTDHIAHGELIFFYVEHAKSVEQAAQLLKMERWNFFIVDYYLKDSGSTLTGIDFIHLISERGINVPALLISGVNEMVFSQATLMMIQDRKLRFVPKKGLTWEKLNVAINDIYTRIIKVLQLDDDPDEFDIIADYLQEVGYLHFELDCVRTVEKAREYLAQTHYDVAIVDYYLRAEKGSELLESLPAEHTPDQIILCTGSDQVQLDPESIRRIGYGKITYFHKNNMDRRLLVDTIVDHKMRTNWLDYAISRDDAS